MQPGKIECRADLQASTAYRQNLAAVLARRVLTAAQHAEAVSGMIEVRASEKVRIRFTLNGREIGEEAAAAHAACRFLRHVLHAHGRMWAASMASAAPAPSCSTGAPCAPVCFTRYRSTAPIFRRSRGLGPGDGKLNDLQDAFRRHHALQCGFCTAGILISATQFFGRASAAEPRTKCARCSPAISADAPVSRHRGGHPRHRTPPRGGLKHNT
jgi:2-furoyl-CoA dehydrogenase 2Fe-2S iron sulfur subunit